MMSHGFKRYEYDSCVYVKFVDESPIYLLLYVDDMLIAAKSMKEITVLKKQLSSEFEMKDLGPAKKILGMEISRDKNLDCYFLVRRITLRKFFIVLTCMMPSLLVLLLLLTLSCQRCNVLVLTKIL